MGEKNENINETVTDTAENVEVNEEHIDEPKEKTELEQLKEENEALANQVNDLKHEYLKNLADTENVKKRLQREHEQLVKYRIQGFATEVLPVIDNLERALSQESSDEALREGVQMIYDQLMASLKSEGVEPIEALNQPFDPNIHQAMMTEACEGIEPNIIIEEYQKGYMIKDRILRASLVKVSQ